MIMDYEFQLTLEYIHHQLHTLSAERFGLNHLARPKVFHCFLQWEPHIYVHLLHFIVLE